MKNMLEYMDEKNSEKQYFFGTDYFERIWERMIDKAFGIEDKARLSALGVTDLTVILVKTKEPFFCTSARCSRTVLGHDVLPLVLVLYSGSLSRWLLDYGADKVKTPLYPDSIMIFRDKYYVLDAKCYRYGWTGDADHLPNGADINKRVPSFAAPASLCSYTLRNECQ